MEYPSNSNNKETAKKQVPEKKIEKVVTGQVLTKKKSTGSKFKSVFFGGEFKGAFRYILADVLLPAARNLLVDATTKGIETIVYGESRRTQTRRPPEYSNRIQYNRPVNRGVDPYERDRPFMPGQRTTKPLRAETRQQSCDIILSSREEAELVLERLIDIVDMYEVVSLADLYDLVGLPSSHTDNKWGWTFLNNGLVTQVREGYLLQLPPMEAI
jgi:hypothetical protein